MNDELKALAGPARRRRRWILLSVAGGAAALGCLFVLVIYPALQASMVRRELREGLPKWERGVTAYAQCLLGGKVAPQRWGETLLERLLLSRPDFEGCDKELSRHTKGVNAPSGEAPQPEIGAAQSLENAIINGCGFGKSVADTAKRLCLHLERMRKALATLQRRLSRPVWHSQKAVCEVATAEAMVVVNPLCPESWKSRCRREYQTTRWQRGAVISVFSNGREGSAAHRTRGGGTWETIVTPPRVFLDWAFACLRGGDRRRWSGEWVGETFWSVAKVYPPPMSTGRPSAKRAGRRAPIVGSRNTYRIAAHDGKTWTIGAPLPEGYLPFATATPASGRWIVIGRKGCGGPFALIPVNERGKSLGEPRVFPSVVWSDTPIFHFDAGGTVTCLQAGADAKGATLVSEVLAQGASKPERTSLSLPKSKGMRVDLISFCAAGQHLWAFVGGRWLTASRDGGRTWTLAHTVRPLADTRLTCSADRVAVVGTERNKKTQAERVVAKLCSRTACGARTPLSRSGRWIGAMGATPGRLSFIGAPPSFSRDPGDYLMVFGAGSAGLNLRAVQVLTGAGQRRDPSPIAWRVKGHWYVRP